MDAVSSFQRGRRRPSTKLAEILGIRGGNTGLVTNSTHSETKKGRSKSETKKPKKSTSLDNKAFLGAGKKKSSKKKDRLEKESTHSVQRTPLQRQDSEKLIDLYVDTLTPTPSFSSAHGNSPFPFSSSFVGKPSSSKSIVSYSSNTNKGKTKKPSRKHVKASRRQSLPDLSEHSRTIWDLSSHSKSLEEASKHSKSKGSKKKKSSGIGGNRRKSFGDLKKPLDRFLKTEKSEQQVVGESSSSTADTAPNTPYSGMRPTILVEVGNPPNLDATATSALSNTVRTDCSSTNNNNNIPTISEEIKSPAGKSTSSSKKASRRSSSSRKIVKDKDKEKAKDKDKKKSKKGKKKKSDKKEKVHKRKKPKKAKSGSLREHFSNRSLGSFTNSFSSQKSFESARSLGSYVSDAPTYVSNTSFVSFVSISVRRNSADNNTLNGSSHHSQKSVRSIKKVRMGHNLGARKVPLVSMPEHSMSPDANKKSFNDNASSHTTASFSQHSILGSSGGSNPNPFKNRYGIQMSPGLLGGSNQKRMTPTRTFSMMTPSTVETSTASSRSLLDMSTHSLKDGPSTPKKYQMVPKSTGLSDPIARWTPRMPTSVSAPSFSERQGSRRSLLGGAPNEPVSPTKNSSLLQNSPRAMRSPKAIMKSPLKPKTSFCSEPKATHPNQSVANAWASPFGKVVVKYADSKEYKQHAKGNGKTKSPKSPSSSRAKSSKLAMKTKCSSPLTIKKPPSEAFEDTRSECSEHSEIEEWDSFGPASLMRSSTYPNSNSNTNTTAKPATVRRSSTTTNSTSGRDNDSFSDDISALTMSLRTDGGYSQASSSVNSPLNRNHKRISSSYTKKNQAPSSKSKSPNPPKIFRNNSDGSDDPEDASERERFMHAFDASGTEGSISLHGGSERSERTDTKDPSDKQTNRPRKKASEIDPTVPRINTPPRIRFGEGASESPRPKDQSPSMPMRRISVHDRGDEPSVDTYKASQPKQPRKVMGIPVVPNLFDGMDSNSTDAKTFFREKLGDIEEVTDHTDRTEDSEHLHMQAIVAEAAAAVGAAKMAARASSMSHGICDDADAAAGSPTPPRGRGSRFDSVELRSAPTTKRTPPAPAASFSACSHRVGALIDSFDSLDGPNAGCADRSPTRMSSRSPSPSFRKRPKGLSPARPMKSTDVHDAVTARRNDLGRSQSPHARLRRSPSLPVTPTRTTPKEKASSRKHIGDLDTSVPSNSTGEKRASSTTRAARSLSPVPPKSPTTMKIKPTRIKNKTVTAARTTTATEHGDTEHSMQKEVVCGTSSDFRGIPQKFVRDASYRNDDTVIDLDKSSRSAISNKSGISNKSSASKMSKTKKPKKTRGGGIKRRSSTGGSEIPPPKPRNRSRSGGKHGKKKKSQSMDDSIADQDHGATKWSPLERRKSTGKDGKKPGERIPPSPRRRSRTPDSRYGRGSSDDDTHASKSPRRKYLSKPSKAKGRNGSTSEPTTPIGGANPKGKIKRISVPEAPATVGCNSRRGRSDTRAGYATKSYLPELPLAPFARSPSRSPSVSSRRSARSAKKERRSRKSRSPCGPSQSGSKARAQTKHPGGSPSRSCSPRQPRRSGSLSKSPKRSSLPCPPKQSLFDAIARKSKKKQAKEPSSSKTKKKTGGNVKKKNGYGGTAFSSGGDGIKA